MAALIPFSARIFLTCAFFLGGSPRIVPMYLPWSLRVASSSCTLSVGSQHGSLPEQFTSREQEPQEAEGKVGDDDDRSLEEYEETGVI